MSNPLQTAEIGLGEVIPLARPVPTVLGVGAFLKSTVCLAEDRTATVTAPIGNLDTVDAVLAFERNAERLLAAARHVPVAVVHDRHPDFISTRYAESLADAIGVPALPVQHHHAHVSAVMAEHGIDSPTLGLTLDGFGLGDDDTSWGGELLLVDRDGFRRLGHLRPLPQPGGDRAAREPWRMGAAALHELGRGHEIGRRFASFPGADVIAAMLEGGINAPPTSSCGRLFDAACGLLGVTPVATFEGEAPMALEALAARPRIEPDGWHLDSGILDLRPLLSRLVDMDAVSGANLFHGTLAAALIAWVAEAAEQSGVRRVALGGGCFFNRVLTKALVEGLASRGLQTLIPVRLAPGDTAVSVGQAWAAALMHG